MRKGNLLSPWAFRLAPQTKGGTIPILFLFPDKIKV
jgi:hypothetical protein